MDFELDIPKDKIMYYIRDNGDIVQVRYLDTIYVGFNQELKHRFAIIGSLLRVNISDDRLYSETFFDYNQALITAKLRK